MPQTLQAASFMFAWHPRWRKSSRLHSGIKSVLFGRHSGDTLKKFLQTAHTDFGNNQELELKNQQPILYIDIYKPALTLPRATFQILN